MLGGIRRMSFREPGREPIWGWGVWPRGMAWAACWAKVTPLGMGGDADGVAWRRCGNGCWPWKCCGGIRWPPSWGGVASPSSSDASSTPPFEVRGALVLVWSAVLCLRAR